MELLKVARVPPIFATPGMTVSEAVALMVKHGVGAVVVTTPDKRPLGMFTERDNLVRVTFKRMSPDRTRLAEVMTAPVDTVPPETSVEDALETMIRRHYRHLPIVDSTERVIGIVSVRYLLMRRLSEKQSTLDVLEAYAGAGGPG